MAERIMRFALVSLIASAIGIASLPAFAQQPSKITLEDAIKLALDNSPTIRAQRTNIDQSKAQEITANLRPNPVLGWDTQFIPLFSPNLFSTDTLNNLQQFDIGVGYLFERGKKRQRRLEAAKDQTAVTDAQVHDAERALSFNVAQQFVNVLLAESNLQFTATDLDSYVRTVQINEDRYKAGDLSKVDFLKIKVQLLQFQTDVNVARLQRVQALTTLRQLIGYDQLPKDYDVIGELEYKPVHAGLDDLEALALRERPDYRATQLGINSAQSQLNLAKANGKQDLDVTFDFSHVSAASSGSFFFNIPLPVFNRNQGEIARTRFALTQSQFTSTAARDTVFTDVRNAFEGLNSNQEIVTLYQSGYLQQAQESRDISEFAYKQGAAALLDYLDAERSYRATQLVYRQALAAYMVSLEQLKQATGTRNLP
jgi:cobalt-zinc-cadmium efflux system outer membrane protein